MGIIIVLRLFGNIPQSLQSRHRLQGSPIPVRHFAGVRNGAALFILFGWLRGRVCPSSVFVILGDMPWVHRAGREETMRCFRAMQRQWRRGRGGWVCTSELCGPRCVEGRHTGAVTPPLRCIVVVLDVEFAGWVPGCKMCVLFFMVSGISAPFSVVTLFCPLSMSNDRDRLVECLFLPAR